MKGLIMKRKIAISLLTLIVALMCCGCTSEIPPNQTYFTDYEIVEDYNGNATYDEYEFDITYKKDKDDLSPAVYVTKYGKRYHTPSCHHTQNAYMRLTVKQAWDRGYTPCYFCCY